MLAAHFITRVVLAAYLTFGLPICCCYASVVTDGIPPTHLPDDEEVFQTEIEVVHVHAGHQHRLLSCAGECPQEPAAPCDDDDSCDCGCDSSTALLLDISITIDQSVHTTAIATVDSLTPMVLVQQGWRSSPPGVMAPPTSLVRMHCALII